MIQRSQVRALPRAVIFLHFLVLGCGRGFGDEGRGGTKGLRVQWRGVEGCVGCGWVEVGAREVRQCVAYRLLALCIDRRKERK